MFNTSKEILFLKDNVGKVAPNLLGRDFYANKPNEKWVTDITEFQLHGEKLYLSPVLDLFNGEIIAYEISNRSVFSPVESVLTHSYNRLSKGDKPILHSDQVWHYQMKKYQSSLKEHKIIQSMSRKGSCLDNAIMANFFGHLKAELLYLQKFDSMEHFKKD